MNQNTTAAEAERSIAAAARAHYLEILGAAPVEPDDPVPEDAHSVFLLGPMEPGFWTHFKTQPEAQDGGPNPLDRWSRRVITQVAASIGGTPVFPFDGPPYAPFIRWALASGSVWVSPAGLLIHERTGLFTSFRGGIALRQMPPRTNELRSPCDSCTARPCLSACPVSALSVDGYDVAACHAYLDSPPGAECLNKGCAVRRACPVSQKYGRLEEQSAFHMKAFHP